MYSDFRLLTQKFVKNLKYHELYGMLLGHSPIPTPQRAKSKDQNKIPEKEECRLSCLICLFCQGPQWKYLFHLSFDSDLQKITQVSSVGEKGSLCWHLLVCTFTGDSVFHLPLVRGWTSLAGSFLFVRICSYFFHRCFSSDKRDLVTWWTSEEQKGENSCVETEIVW